SEPDIGTAYRREMETLMNYLKDEIPKVVCSIDERIALPPDAGRILADFREPLPEKGNGARAAIERLIDLNDRAGGNVVGPKSYHFVIGGSTPAALAADLLATAYEAITYTWVLSPTGVEMEIQALDWLKELFGLPAQWPGVMVTGATMANFVCLAAGRQWWGEQQGVDVSETGLAGLPQMPVLTSGFVHAATLKCMATQGVGRSNVQKFCRDDFGRLDLDAMARALDELDGAPAMVIVNAGEVNAGEFDPVEDMIALAREHNCWVHVDGAFGLFAAVSPRTEDLVRGVERADSVTVDGHKWLNVPYDSGYAFVRDYGLMARAFRYSADYLPDENSNRPTPGAIGPESSRRARSFAVWATLSAYGREGVQRLVEHCLDIAEYFAGLVRDADDFELMNDPRLNIVSFRYNPGGMSDGSLDDLNERLGEAVIADGRYLVGTSKMGARTIFRPAFSNWRTRKTDVEEMLGVIREVAAKTTITNRGVGT
ncbi:MAG: aminotransferase class V-fold PLP-dependent enzyme, partial [Gammaproteobacteria bacterium]|nr:aminotransferase class V-fold PLP-dependent enzyme [Gammaproteobacteria bacterium]